MAYDFPPDVDKLVRDHLASGGYDSEDDVLRDALQSLREFVHSEKALEEEYVQTIAAVREGMADADSGRMRPLRDVING